MWELLGVFSGSSGQVCFRNDSKGAVDGNVRSHKTTRKSYFFSCSTDEQKRRGLSPMVVSSGLAKFPEASWIETVSVPLSLGNLYLPCSWLSSDSSCKCKERNKNFNKGQLFAWFFPTLSESVSYVLFSTACLEQLKSCERFKCGYVGWLGLKCLVLPMQWSSSLSPQAYRLGSC